MQIIFLIAKAFHFTLLALLYGSIMKQFNGLKIETYCINIQGIIRYLLHEDLILLHRYNYHPKYKCICFHYTQEN